MSEYPNQILERGWKSNKYTEKSSDHKRKEGIMKIRMKKLTALLLAGVMVLSLGACGNSKKDDGDSKDGDKIVLTLSHNWVEGAGGNSCIFDFIKEYEKDNPGVKIETQALGHDDYEVKIATQIASGDVPDIFEYKGGMFVNVLQNDLAIPLNDIMEEDKEWTDGFRDGIFNDFTSEDGKVYGFPVEYALTTVLYYNKDILKKVGYDAPPEKWSDFLTMCDKLNEAGYTPVAFGNAAGWPVESDAFSKFANDRTGTDWFWDLKYGNGKSSFEDKEFVESLDMLKEAYDRKMFNEDINTLEYSLGVQKYMDGKAAMMMDGSWSINTLMGSASKEIQDATEFSFFPLKDGAKGDAKAVCGGAGWGIGINSKLKGEKLKYAKDFCKRFFGPENTDRKLKAGAIPATKVDDYSEYDPMLQRYMASVGEQYSELAQCYSVHLPTNLINVFYNGLQDFMAGNVSSKDFAKELQAEYENTDLKTK